MVRSAALALVAGIILFQLDQAHASPSFPVDPVPERVAVDEDDGTSTTVARVERWPGDFVRLISGTGDIRFRSIHAIHAIRDEAGSDVTERVLRGWESFGTGPTAPEMVGEPSPKRIPDRFKREFVVVQAGILGRMNATRGESDAAVSIDLGTMRNLSSNHAIGGTLGLVADEEYLRIALKPRVRRWMTSSLALDVAPGIFHSVDSEDLLKTHGPVGFLLETSLIWSGLAVTGQLEVVGTEQRHYEYGGPPEFATRVTTESATEASYHMGVKLGGNAAVPASFVMLLAILVMGSASGDEIY